MANPRTVCVAGDRYPVSGVSQHVIQTVANRVPRVLHPDKWTTTPLRLLTGIGGFTPLKTMGFVVITCESISKHYTLPDRPQLLRLFNPPRPFPSGTSSAWLFRTFEERQQNVTEAIGKHKQGTESWQWRWICLYQCSPIRTKQKPDNKTQLL